MFDNVLHSVWPASSTRRVKRLRPGAIRLKTSPRRIYLPGTKLPPPPLPPHPSSSVFLRGRCRQCFIVTPSFKRTMYLQDVPRGFTRCEIVTKKKKKTKNPKVNENENIKCRTVNVPRKINSIKRISSVNFTKIIK